MTFTSFEELDCWQAARDAGKLIRGFIKKLPTSERYDLIDNMRRASRSSTRNIAEGFGRDSTKEYLRFLNISIGSLFELQTQLEISKNIEYLTKEEYTILYDDSREVERMLVSFINKIKERN